MLARFAGMDGGMLAEMAGLRGLGVQAQDSATKGDAHSHTGGAASAAPPTLEGRNIVLTAHIAGDPFMLSALRALQLTGAASFAASKSVGALVGGRLQLGEAPVHAMLHVATTHDGSALEQLCAAFLDAAMNCGYTSGIGQHDRVAGGESWPRDGDDGDSASDSDEEDRSVGAADKQRNQRHDTTTTRTSSSYKAAFGPVVLPEVEGGSRPGVHGSKRSSIAERLRTLASASMPGTHTARPARVLGGVSQCLAWLASTRASDQHLTFPTARGT